MIWDPTVIAWLVCPEGEETQLRHSPIVTLEGTYSVDENRHLYGYVSRVDRDRIFGDLFRRLQWPMPKKSKRISCQELRDQIYLKIVYLIFEKSCIRKEEGGAPMGQTFFIFIKRAGYDSLPFLFAVLTP